MKTYVGIDFGACDIKAAKISPQTKRIQPVKLNMNIAGGGALPAAILYDKINDNIEIKIGDSAKFSADTDNKISRLMPKLARKTWKKFIPNLDAEISAADAVSDIFKKIWRHIANQAAQDENFDVTVAVPATFSDAQKKIIRQAAIRADVPISNVITAPFAEIFSCEELLTTPDAQNVLVMDFGATTIDANIFKLERTPKSLTVTEIFAANLNYGGANIDYSILINIFTKKYPNLFTIFLENKFELMALITSMKEEIFLDEEEISTGNLIDGQGNFYEFELTRQEVFAALEVDNVEEKIISMLDEMFDDAEISPAEIDIVKIFGGTAAVDYFSDILQNYFGENIFDAESIEREGLALNAAIGATNYRELTDEENLRVKVKNFAPCGIYILRGNKFFRCIKRNELRGFVTPYKPLLVDELKKNNWRLAIYRSFSNAAELPIDSNDAVYIGDVRLSARQYDSEVAILFKMQINSAGQLIIKFFEDDEQITFVEEKVLDLGKRKRL